MKQKEELFKISLPINGKMVDFKFRPASKMIYAKLFKDLNSQNYYDVVDVIVKNCYVDEGYPLVDDEPTKMELSAQLISKFLTFKEVTIETVYDEKEYADEYAKLKVVFPFVFVVKVDGKTIFIKPLQKDDYRQLFNLSIAGTIQATSYVFDNLVVGGDKTVQSNDAYFVSCFSIAEYLLKYKESDLKKK